MTKIMACVHGKTMEGVLESLIYTWAMCSPSTWPQARLPFVGEHISPRGALGKMGSTPVKEDQRPCKKDKKWLN